MNSHISIDPQLQEYHQQLDALKKALEEEAKCRAASTSAEREFEVLNITAPPEMGIMAPSAEDKRASYDKMSERTNELRAAKKEVAQIKKSVQACEDKLVQDISMNATQDILKIQNEQLISGFSKKSGAVLLEMLEQIQTAQGTDQLKLLTSSLFQILGILSVDTDRLNIDNTLDEIEKINKQLSEIDPSDKAAYAKVTADMKAAVNTFLEEANETKQALADDKASKQQNLVLLGDDLHKQMTHLKTLQDSLKKNKNADPKLRSQIDNTEKKIESIQEKIDQEREMINVLNGGISKIKDISKLMTSMNEFPEKLTKAEAHKLSEGLQRKMDSVVSVAVNRPIDEIRQEGIHRVNQYSVQSCLKSISQLCYVKLGALTLEEQLKDENGRKLLKDVMINSIMSGLSLLVSFTGSLESLFREIHTSAEGAGRILDDVHSGVSKIKTIHSLHELTQKEDDSDAKRNLVDSTIDYVKKNPGTVGLNAAVAATAIVCFILFPPSTALGVMAAVFSGKSTGLNLKTLVTHTALEISTTHEVSKVLDRHAELIKILSAEAKASPKKGDLSILQEAGILAGILIDQTTAAMLSPPKPSTSTTTVLSKLSTQLPSAISSQSPPVPVKLTTVPLEPLTPQPTPTASPAPTAEDNSSIRFKMR